MSTGIYSLKFTNNLVYIGQSIDIEARYKKHCRELKNGTHTNYKLQNAYINFGIPQLEILLECSKNELNANEIAAIEVYDTIDNGLNIAPGGGAASGLIGEKHPFSKYSNEQLISAVKYLADNLNQSLKLSADILGIEYGTVRGLVRGDRHIWIKNIIPKEYNILMDFIGKRSINTASNKGKNYTIISPKGIQYSVNNINEFARQHNLSASNLQKVLVNKRKSHKGWTAVK
jgi:hypothetical protein